MSLFINSLVELSPSRVKIGQGKEAANAPRHLANEVGQPVACLHAIRPMHIDTEILRLLPATFDKPATLAEGRTPQHRVIVEKNLVVDIASRKLVIKNPEHLQIEVAH